MWAAEPPHTLHLTLNVTIDESNLNPTVNSMMLMVTGKRHRRYSAPRSSVRSSDGPQKDGGLLQGR